MSQRPCWNEEELLQILKPDAEEIQDEVFRAVHCETDLHIADSADGPRTPASSQALLDRFLDPMRDYVQAVVIGESGTGKSHLIQWLRLNIPKQDDTVMLTIPRTGTSLRGIVGRIIAELPAHEREPYEQRLVQAGAHAMTQVAKVEKFLSELAHAIRHAGLATDPTDVDLADLLPSVLLDPNFREKFFLRNGATVDMIVRHVFVDPGERDVDDLRREFQTGDLPLDGQNYLNASLQAREAIDFIKGEEGMEARAIALMNAHRNIAIAQTLNFSADQLIELMNTLRRHLARQGKRLILLIEDFARVQGIDSALLQALITPPKQGGERLCEIRWAMAVTSGPFKRLEQTVRSRTTFVVDMDQSQPASLAQLTGGYLNAMRIGTLGLNKIEAAQQVPSHCYSCALRPSCWEAFGQVNEVGLFPFTEASLKIMATRTESLVDDGALNPRRYMRTVLEGVLKHHYAELVAAEFPSTTLLKRIGGRAMLRPITRQSIEHQDVSHHARRIALLELYDGSGHIVDLARGIHDAFDLPLLGLDKPTGDPKLEKEDGESTPRPTPASPHAIEQWPSGVAKVHRWADGGILPQDVMAELRPLIFGALESYIDWDRLGMRRAAVAVASGSALNVPFRQSDINFTRRQGIHSARSVVLEISEEHALALEALLTHKANAGWDFPESADMLANLLESLRCWGEQVTTQLRAIYAARKNWSPVEAATELLTLACYLGGKVKVGDNSVDTLTARMWEPGVLAPVQSMTAPLRVLNAELEKHTGKLAILLLNHATGTKGGRQGNFVRPWPVLKAVRTLRQRSLELTQDPPEDIAWGEIADLAKLYRRVKAELPNAIAVEKAARLEWVVGVKQAMGDDITVTIFVSEVRGVIEQLVDYGLRSNYTRTRLAEELDKTKPATLDVALTHAKALPAANFADSLSRISAMGSHHETLSRLIGLTSEFLETAEASAENEKASLLAKNGSGLQDSETRIQVGLDAIGTSLQCLAALHGGPDEFA